MEKSNNQLKILSALITKTDLFDLEEKIEILTSLLGKIDTNYEAQIKAVLDNDSYDALTKDFQDLNLKLNSSTDLEKYLNLIKEKVQSFKFLKLTLAINASEELVETISYWITKNIGQMVLIDLNFDKSIIAGGLIEYEGKYKDFSIKSKLEKYFKINPALI
jgi:F0F1-type ATP synthase delta subunit